jgi:hypothetical protein
MFLVVVVNLVIRNASMMSIHLSGTIVFLAYVNVTIDIVRIVWIRCVYCSEKRSRSYPCFIKLH